MTLFLSILLLIEVIISSIFALILLFIVIRKKDGLFSRKAFERLQELKRSFKVLYYLFILTLIFFLLHEIIDIVHHFHPSPSSYLNLLKDIRHVLIYLFLVPLQGLSLYLILRLKENVK